MNEGTVLAPSGDGLDSFEKTAKAFTVTHPRDPTQRLIPVSFDGTHGDDKRVMKDIFDWLASQCVYFTLRISHSTNSLPHFSQDMTIAGFIYFHDIALTRMEWATLSAFTTLLCGDALPKNVLLVTTKWGEVDPAEGEKREEDLRNIHWKEMVQSGATMARFEPTPTSTSAILDILLRNPAISVQTLMDQRKSLKPAKGIMIWLRKAFTGSRHKSQN